MDIMFFICCAAGVLAFITGYCTIFEAFLEERTPEKGGKRVLPYLVYFIGYSILYEVWPRHETWVDLLLGSIVSIVIFLIYRAELAKAMAGTALAVSIALLADAMLVLVVSIVEFFNVSADLIPVLQMLKETMGVGILFLILTMIFSVFFNRSVPRGELVTRLYRAGANMMPILCIVSAVTIVEQVYVLQIDDLSLESLIVAAITLVLLAMMSFYLFGELKETEKLQREKETMEIKQLAYAHALDVEQAAYEKTQRLRHDMKNHVILIGEYLRRKEYAQIGEYIFSIYHELEKTGVYSDSGCREIDIILNYKLADTREKGIETEVSVLVPRSLGVEAFDLNVLLGNLLDNALEGVERSEEKRIVIKIKMVQGVLYVRIRNSYDGIVVRDVAGGYRTRKKEEKQHSIGLQNIKQVVEKYNGNLQILPEEKEFEVNVMLYPQWNSETEEKEISV